MKYLRILGFLCLGAGLFLIAFSKRLGALYEGGAGPTMSDLGFIAYGMAFFAAGTAITLLVILAGLKRRRSGRLRP